MAQGPGLAVGVDGAGQQPVQHGGGPQIDDVAAAVGGGQGHGLGLLHQGIGLREEGVLAGDDGSGVGGGARDDVGIGWLGEPAGDVPLPDHGVTGHGFAARHVDDLVHQGLGPLGVRGRAHLEDEGSLDRPLPQVAVLFGEDLVGDDGLVGRAGLGETAGGEEHVCLQPGLFDLHRWQRHRRPPGAQQVGAGMAADAGGHRQAGVALELPPRGALGVVEGPGELPRQQGQGRVLIGKALGPPR